MQQYTLEQTMAAVAGLNTTDRPFQYRVEGNQIIGEWKYLDATWAAPLAAGNVDKNFRITVTLDEASRTYRTQDQATEKTSKFSFDPATGSVSFGGGMNGFQGHKIGMERGIGLGQANQSQNQVAGGAPAYQYNFNTETIKRPLFDFLAQTGWQKQKSGLFGRFFGS